MDIVRKSGVKRSNCFGVSGAFTFECYDKHGTLKWSQTIDNGWTNVGLQYLMDRTFKASKPSEQSYYIGLISSSAVLNNSDTMGSHTGWTEITDYSDASRPAWGESDPALDASDNVNVVNAATVDFTVDADSQVIDGAFVTTENTKGGTTGTLITTAEFASAQSLDDNDILKVTYTLKGSAV